jgi:hypothetical protein
MQRASSAFNISPDHIAMSLPRIAMYTLRMLAKLPVMP